jgi:hypothetical protein
MPLTELQIKNVRPQPGKTVRLFDARGLYLEVSETGRKWWRLKYRYAGKEKRLSLGVYPETSLKAARARCDEARKLLSDGVDPSQQRKVDRLVRAERSEDTEIIHHRERWANELYLVYADGRTLKLTEAPAKKEGETDGECTPSTRAA